MARLTLDLLGPFRLADDGQPVNDLRTDKARGLLAYLASEPDRPHRREALASLLWPEMPDVSALSNLRKSLHRLGQALPAADPGPAELLTATRQTVQLNSAHIAIDVSRFDQLLREAEAHPHRHLHVCAACLERLRQAAGLYRGDFLAGFGISDAPEFEQWLLARREALRSQALTGLYRLAEAYERRGDYGQAQACAARQLALEPSREEAHRQLMRALALGGRRSEALAQFEVCRRTLAEELDVAPAAETLALYEQIRAQAAPVHGGNGHAYQPAAALHHFPSYFTPFVGRAAELDQIVANLADPDCRLLTLLGPGGAGKTRLSCQAARLAAARPGFEDGVYFAALETITELDLLVTALAGSLGLGFQEQAAPRPQLIDYLREKRLLLVLDNFEQLLAAAPVPTALDLLLDLLAAAPGVKLLVTSRVPLAVQAEWRLPVEGLEYPAGGDEPQAGRRALGTYSAVQLFEAAALRFRPAFAVSAEQDALADICRLVWGMPLALEMAAAWAASFDCRTIATEIERNLDFLASPLHDLPPRHRSLRAVFEHSWRLLGPEEQKALALASVFRSGFSAEAAREILETTPRELAALAARSLIQPAETSRYAMHELLQQFAAGKLAGLGTDSERVKLQERFAAHYLRLVAASEAGFFGSEPQQTWASLRADLGNIRQAWQWAAAQRQYDLLAPAADGLSSLYQFAGLFREGETEFQFAAEQVAAQEPAGAQLLRSHLLSRQAEFHIKTGAFDQARAAAQEALALAEGPDGAPHRAQAQVILGRVEELRGEYERALSHLEPALGYYLAANQPRGQALAVNRIGNVHWRRSRHDLALAAFQEALALEQGAGHLQGITRNLSNLGIVYRDLGEFERALDCMQRALEIDEALGSAVGIARQLNNMGLAHWQLGHLDRALACYERALGIARDLGHKRGMSLCIGNMGIIYREQGQYDQALNCYRQALQLAEALGARPAMSNNIGNIGNVYRELGDGERARQHYERALAIDREIGNQDGLARHLGYLAALSWEQGDAAQARALFDQSIPLLRAMRAKYYLAWQLIDQAEVLLHLGQVEAAEALQVEGLAIAAEINRREYVFKGRLLAALIQHAAGRPAAATRQLLAALLAGADEPQRAEVHYALWRLGQAAHGRAARELYTQLAARSANALYRRRLAELATTRPRS